MKGVGAVAEAERVQFEVWRKIRQAYETRRPTDSTSRSWREGWASRAGRSACGSGIGSG